MAVDNTILIRRGSGSPSYSDFTEYELAYDYSGNKLYIRDGNAMEEIGKSYSGGTNLTLSGTTFNVDDAFLKNDASDTMNGSLTVTGVVHVQSGDDFALGEITNTLRMKGNSTNAFNFLNNGNGWAHLNCGNVVAAGSVSIGGHAVNDIDIGSEFVDADDHLMTSGAIKEKIESYGYTTSSAVSAVANGSNNRIATFSSSTALNGEANLTFDGTNLDIAADDSKLRLGEGNDGQIYVSSDNLIIRNVTADKDVILQSDDGSGGETAYLTLDGSDSRVDFFSGRIHLKNDGTFHWGSAAAHGVLSWDTGRAIVSSLGSNNLDLKAPSGYSVVVNESSSDVDFRVESNGKVNAIHVDAGADKVNIDAAFWSNYGHRIGGLSQQGGFGTNTNQLFTTNNIMTFADNTNWDGAMVINTNITRASARMCTITVKGYGYGNQSFIDFDVNFYTYSGVNGDDGVAGYPYAARINDRGNDKKKKFVGVNSSGNVAIAIGDYNDANKYYYGFKVSLDNHLNGSGASAYQSWTVTKSTTDGFGWLHKDEPTRLITGIASQDASYTKILNPNGAVSMYLGGTADGNNYYQAGEHRFRNYAGSAYYARIGSGYIRGEGGGSASTPCFSFSSDTNTGVYSHAADQLGFSTGGTNRMTLTNSGLTLANGGVYSGDSTSGVLSTGSWAGDLVSGQSYERVCGLSHDGGEFVIVEKSGRVSVLVDGDYFAYENNGFWSSNNSSYGNATGFKSNGAAMMQVCQKDGGTASLQSTGDLIVNSGFISGVGSADLQLRRTTNSDDRIVIEASQTVIYGDAVERVRFGSWGIRNNYFGSNSAPSYSFVSDSDTGMFRSAANQLGFAVGGNEKVTIDSSGRVGIGVNSSIQEELDVNGVGKFRGNSQGSDVLELGQLNDGATTQQYLISTYDTAGGIRNVGDHMQIKSQRWGQDITFARNGQGGAVPTARFYNNGSNGYMELYKASNPSSDATYTNPIQLNVNGNSWLNGGNVGVGTSSPGSLLTVYKDGTQVSNPSTSYQIMTVSNSNGGIAIQAGASSDAFLVFGDYGQYDAGRIRYHNDTHFMDFCTAGNNPRMTIKNDGKIVVNGTDSDGMFRVNSTSAENAVKIYANAARGASRHALHIDDNDTNGRGSVVIDSASGTGMKITTQNSNWNMELVSADGGGSPAMSMGVRMQSFEGRANGHYQFDEDYSGQWFSGNRYAGNMQSWQVGYRDGSSGNTPDYIDRARIYVTTDGDLHANEDVIAFSSTIGSDKKLKKNVKDINYGLKDVLNIRAVEFDWKEKRKGQHDIGFIAQEIEKIIPEVVNEVMTIGEGAKEGDTHKTVDYAKLTSVLIKAVQEQQQQINELKEKLNG